MGPAKPRIIFHIDMDAFYASIEQRDNPAYAGKPVIVGALPGHRGVVSAASYEARKFGIHSAMPVVQAHRRCPDGIYVRPNMRKYVRESKLVMGILERFSPAVEQISVDEAFLDMSGTERHWHRSGDAARAIAETILTERRITASIGIGPNKFLAKIASDLNKPNGITEVPLEPKAVAAWLAPLPVRRMWGVGRKTEAVLTRLGLATIGDLQDLSRDSLSERFGKWGDALYDLCRGTDTRGVVVEPDGAKSISRENTFGADTPDRNLWEKTLLALAQDVGRRARRARVKGRTVVLIYRMSDFQKHTRRRTLKSPTDLAKRIYDEARGLLSAIPKGRSLRLIGVGITGLGGAMQTDLFGQDEERGWQAFEEAIDRLAGKFGRRAVVRGRELD